MNKILRFFGTICCFCLLTNAAFGQIADGSIAPNFKTTDINGNEIELYDLIAQGYEVVLDFSATWCGPCWDYHLTHELDDLFTRYGPDGTKEVYVLYLESDDGTTSDDLAGTGTATAGNWIEGTSYPIIDDAGYIANLYEITGYPTIMTVCGGGFVYDVERLTSEQHYDYASDEACFAPSSETGIFSDNLNISVCEGPVTGTVNLLNSGSEALTNANITLEGCDNCPIDLAWEGSLGYMEYEPVLFENLNIDESGLNLNYTVNAENDGVMTNNNSNQNIQLSGLTGILNVEISLKLDCYPGETSWSIVNGSGEAVFESPMYGEADVYQEYTVNVELPAEDCYTVVIKDAYGDGFYGTSFDCTEDGYFTAKSGNTELININGTTTFTEELSSFNASAFVGVNDQNELNLSIYPNPVSDKLFIQNELSTEGIYEVFDLSGKKISNGIFTQNQLNVVDVQSLLEGIYFIQIKSNDESSTFKFNVVK